MSARDGLWRPMEKFWTSSDTKPSVSYLKGQQCDMSAYRGYGYDPYVLSGEPTQAPVPLSRPTTDELGRAAEEGDIEILEKAHAEGKDLVGFRVKWSVNLITLMHIAVLHEHEAIIRFLHTLDPTMVNSTVNTETPLLISITRSINHASSTTNLLLDLGSVGTPYPHYMDILFYRIAKNNLFDVLQRLLPSQAHRLVQTKLSGWTPVDTAIELGHSAVAAELIAHGSRKTPDTSSAYRKEEGCIERMKKQHAKRTARKQRSAEKKSKACQ